MPKADLPAKQGPFRNRPGFTLIELLVVIFLLSLLAFFSFPRLAGFFPGSGKDDIARWLITRTARLKIKAVQQQIPYVLQVDISAGQFRVMAGDSLAPEWEEEGVATTGMDVAVFPGKPVEDMLELGDTAEIVAVLFPGAPPLRSGTADIRFHEKGYSDRAVIHVQDGRERFSFYIAPFLSITRVYDGHVDFAGGRR